MSRSYKKNWIYKDNSRRYNNKRQINSSLKRSKLKQTKFEDTPQLITKRLSAVYGLDEYSYCDYILVGKFRSESIKGILKEDESRMYHKYINNLYYSTQFLDKVDMFLENKKRYIFKNYYFFYKK